MSNHDPLCPLLDMRPETIGIQQSCRCDLIARVRADERERAIAEIQEKHRYEDARRMADLRARVESLPGRGLEIPFDGEGTQYTMVRRDDVLALLDGDES